MAKQSIRTPTWIRPSKIGKQRKLKIPQPEERPLRLRTRDVVRWSDVNIDLEEITVHKRGIRRKKIGLDPLEMRATQGLKGTLPERIVYAYLVEKLRMRPGADFDFQSSLEGGRLELGGIVADFLFPILRMIIQVQGSTHDTFLRSRKDEEQAGDLNRMGYTVYAIDDDIIYNEFLFEETMRRIFGLPVGRGGSGGAYGSHESEDYEQYVPVLIGIASDIRSSLSMFDASDAWEKTYGNLRTVRANIN